MKKFYTSLIFFYLISTTFLLGQDLKLGADRLDQLLPLLQEKKIGLVVNQTSCLSSGVHLLDTLLTHEVNVIKIFAPEHGFRGDADAGEKITDGKDSKTGIPVISLYSKNYKPRPDQIEDLDIIIFDIQDVGTRFYTYISTMHYVMEACAENDKSCIILDRPNPNDYIDGPILDLKYRSFVGMHPIPVVHGLTIGELARMINGELWLKDKKQCNLQVVTMTGWVHGQEYILPIKPSPNLPNQQAIKLYPSLCFFEATNVSVGRGTNFPFQVIGAPERKYGDFSFIPVSTPGAKNPLNMNKKCYGIDLRSYKTKPEINLDFLLSFYQKSEKGAAFFSNPKFMDLLSGSNSLRLLISKNKSAEEIKQTWQEDIAKYKTIRERYLLYPDNK
ncbi:exo-beta-N-acetylmuramidase NamZ domain-containing protein [Dysgonomonas sp. Marseille-P4361]|uniref:exo-beta-N-acetylmuramidase NamZ family protein n=1 Tax=Dysgonomonas sp. Marseille-P4361 TaxID=2161820 RepID=UPI000D558000|nr:DUF1343 domain-containing protein [Dysgonomonas sp. Marseille-P4361]